MTVPCKVIRRPSDSAIHVVGHGVAAEIEAVTIVLCLVGDSLAVQLAVCAAGIGNGNGRARLGDRQLGSAAVLCEDGRLFIIRVQRIRAGGGDLIPAGDLRSGIVHRAVHRQNIVLVLRSYGDGAASQVDLAGFGDVQIDTGSVGVDGAAVILAALLVSEGGLLKQQLIADGGDSCVFFRQQGDGVVFNRLLQSRVGGAIIAHLSSSSLIGDFSVGVVASRCGNAVFPCGSQQVCEKLTGNSW